jgi:hypothetical protein
MSDASGNCLCGDVRFTLSWPSLWVAHCHCTLCRRAHGAAFVTWIGMEAAQCAIEDPYGRLRWYDSSPGAERGFCDRCGSSLFFRSTRWPGQLDIALANLQGEADRAPSEHGYWEHRAPWAAVDPDDGLPRKIGDDSD